MVFEAMSVICYATVANGWSNCVEINTRRALNKPERIVQGCDIIEKDIKQLAKKWGLMLVKYECKRSTFS